MLIIIALTGERTLQMGNSLCDFLGELTNTWLAGGSDGEESACNAGDADSVPESGRSPGERNGYPVPFLPGEFHAQRSLAGYSIWGHNEADH